MPELKWPALPIDEQLDDLYTEPPTHGTRKQPAPIAFPDQSGLERERLAREQRIADEELAREAGIQGRVDSAWWRGWMVGAFCAWGLTLAFLYIFKWTAFA